MEVSVSSHYLNKNKVSRAMQEGKVLYTREALLPNSSEWRLAEHQENDVPDLLPTQESNASSTDKVMESAEPVQETEGKSDVEVQKNAEAAKQMADETADESPKPKDEEGKSTEESKESVSDETADETDGKKVDDNMSPEEPESPSSKAEESGIHHRASHLYQQERQDQ